MKAVIYTRTASESSSSQRQLEQCQTFAAVHGWDVAGIYSECCVSGRSADRRTLNLAMQQARNQECGVLIVSDATRLTRDASGLASILRDADAAGVRVVTADGALDTTTKESRPVARLMTWVAGNDRASDATAD